MRIDSPEDLDRIDFAKGAGLVPVIAQDLRDGKVLMVAWADREALEKSLSTGQMHFHSRSRSRLWRKGESSGNTLELARLWADCDADTVLALVRPAGPACHTGATTCFAADGERLGLPTLASLAVTIDARASTGTAGDGSADRSSYTVRLLEDRNLRLKKLSEEVGELLVALADGDRKAVRAEAADLVYHLLVACKGADVELADLLEELEDRGPRDESGS